VKAGKDNILNIMFFLTPKGDVAYLYDTDTLRQALEKMENHRYSAIPIIGEKSGKYIGTVTEGDILWYIKETGDFSLYATEDVWLMEVKRSRDNQPVNANSDMEEMMEKVMNQNFVPVTDDNGRFIGIITRKDIILYLKAKMSAEEDALDTLKT